jgi:hypothetical protein
MFKEVRKTKSIETKPIEVLPNVSLNAVLDDLKRDMVKRKDFEETFSPNTVLFSEFKRGVICCLDIIDRYQSLHKNARALTTSSQPVNLLTDAWMPIRGIDDVPKSHKCWISLENGNSRQVILVEWNKEVDAWINYTDDILMDFNKNFPWQVTAFCPLLKPIAYDGRMSI